MEISTVINNINAVESAEKKRDLSISKLVKSEQLSKRQVIKRIPSDQQHLFYDTKKYISFASYLDTFKGKKVLVDMKNHNIVHLKCDGVMTFETTTKLVVRFTKMKKIPGNHGVFPHHEIIKFNYDGITSIKKMVDGLGVARHVCTNKRRLYAKNN